MFYGRLFELCHEAYEELLMAMDLGIDQMFDQLGVGTPVVHTEADFVAPIRMHDRLRVALRLERLGARSMSLAYSISGAGGDERAQARVVHAFVRLADFSAVDIPAQFVAGLERVGMRPPASG